MAATLRVVRDNDEATRDLTVAEGLLADAARVAADRPLCVTIISEHTTIDGGSEYQTASRPQSRALLEGLYKALGDVLYPDAPATE